MKRRSGTAQAAQHRHAGPMKHRLQARGGARTVECVDSPTGKHLFSHDAEYAQKHHMIASMLRRSCEYCGEDEP